MRTKYSLEQWEKAELAVADYALEFHKEIFGKETEELKLS